MDNYFISFHISRQNSILDVWQDSEFVSEASNDLAKKLHLRCLIGFWISLCSY